MSNVPPPPSGPQATAYPASGKPDSYLVWAILSTILCCLPLGVVSIVYAAKVDGAWASGRHGEALEASANAKKFAIASAAASAAMLVLYLVAMGVGFAFL